MVAALRSLRLHDGDAARQLDGGAYCGDRDIDVTLMAIVTIV